MMEKCVAGGMMEGPWRKETKNTVEVCVSMMELWNSSVWNC